MSETLAQTVPNPEYRQILGDVLPVVRQASAMALAFQDRVPAVYTKPDRSPVTDADHAVEEFLLNELGRLFPDDGFIGEELRTRPSRSGRKWVVDPIDGTVQFIRGQEFWSILVALEDEKNGKVGIIAFPARDEIIYASEGNGCWEETASGLRQLQVSKIKEAEYAYLLHNGIEFARRAKRSERLMGLLARVAAERGYADAFGHVEVMRGNCEAMIDFLTEPHDIAAVRVAVTEAGGKWSALDGSQILTPDGPGSITTNGHLHDLVREALADEDIKASVLR